MKFTEALLDALKKLPFVAQDDDLSEAGKADIEIPSWPASRTGYRCVWCCARTGNPHEPDCPDVKDNKLPETG
jgi:hypothetical protein